MEFRNVVDRTAGGLQHGHRESFNSDTNIWSYIPRSEWVLAIDLDEVAPVQEPLGDSVVPTQSIRYASYVVQWCNPRIQDGNTYTNHHLRMAVDSDGERKVDEAGEFIDYWESVAFTHPLPIDPYEKLKEANLALEAMSDARNRPPLDAAVMLWTSVIKDLEGLK